MKIAVIVLSVVVLLLAFSTGYFAFDKFSDKPVQGLTDQQGQEYLNLARSYEQKANNLEKEALEIKSGLYDLRLSQSARDMFSDTYDKDISLSTQYRKQALEYRQLAAQD